MDGAIDILDLGLLEKVYTAALLAHTEIPASKENPQSLASLFARRQQEDHPSLIPTTTTHTPPNPDISQTSILNNSRIPSHFPILTLEYRPGLPLNASQSIELLNLIQDSLIEVEKTSFRE